MSGERSRHGAGGAGASRRRTPKSVRQVDCGWLARFRTEEEPEAPPFDPQELRERARRALRSLSAMEAEVLQLRFGIDVADHSLEAVERRLGGDAGSAARVETEALRKLRRVGRRGRETDSFAE